MITALVLHGIVWHRVVRTPPQTLEALTQRVRRKILRRMARMGAVPQEAVEEMLARPRGGFSLDGKVRVGAEDRAGLERLLSYCLRPAISLKRLHYLPDQDRVTYRPIKGRPGSPEILEWTPVEFLGRLSRIIAPPRLNLVRYAGALGPSASHASLRFILCSARVAQA